MTAQIVGAPTPYQAVTDPLLIRALIVFSRCPRPGTDECWEWPGAKNDGGYGQMGIMGTVYYTHRLAFRIWHGELEHGKLVMHSCDNPPCWNPRHLSMGTHGDNMRDCVAKGRYVSAWAKKTHCPQGHPYDSVNTYHYKGRRMCRTCNDMKSRLAKTRIRSRARGD